MGIYIPNMEMPTTCEECIGYREDGWYGASCLFLQDEDGWAVEIDDGVTDEYDLEQERHPNCPLVEIPTPHGKIIDVGKIQSKIENQLKGEEITWYQLREVRRYIHDAPTIIEAEE